MGQSEPEFASIERDRKERKKPPIGVRGRNSAVHKTTETKISVVARINAYPNQSLRDSGGNWCG